MKLAKKTTETKREWEVWVNVPSVLCVVDAEDEQEARKLALDVVQENIGLTLKTWSEPDDVESAKVRHV